MSKLTFTIDLQQFADPVMRGTKFQVSVDEKLPGPFAGVGKQWAIERVIDDMMMASYGDRIVKDTIRELGARIGMHLLEEIVARTPKPPLTHNVARNKFTKADEGRQVWVDMQDGKPRCSGTLVLHQDADGVPAVDLGVEGPGYAIAIPESRVYRTRYVGNLVKQSAPYPRYEFEARYAEDVMDKMEQWSDDIKKEPREEADDMLDFFMNRGKYARPQKPSN